MKGDFTRHTFDPADRYSAVLLQQGRVLLDADFNEQTAIQLHLLRTLAADLIGPHGGPGFAIGYREAADDDPADLTIGGGRYYVDGVAADATRAPAPLAVGAGDPAPDPGPWTFYTQPWAFLDPEDDDDALPDGFPYLVYLTVWEELVTAAQEPRLRETALGATMPDTAVRSRVVWQVRFTTDVTLDGSPEEIGGRFAEWAGGLAGTGRLAARVERPAGTDEDPCVISPESRYRGQENQLYRVELVAGDAFVWSRDNGSVAFAIDSVDGRWVTLAALGRDDKLDLHVGDAVQLTDDAAHFRGQAAPVLRIEDVDVPDRRVLLSADPVAGTRNALLRRWDHPATDRPDGAVPLVTGRWLDLEDGVQVWFAPDATYRPGDHWLIPARTLTGAVEWPADDAGRPILRPPHGVHRRYAPLAAVRGANEVQDLRRAIG
ncbi:DUF6519 domain-containing protein [Catenuloplanes atrovinosus]|uniref:Uncharacterized protein n=1 Tax=Catenuloplanes atrovinosus TaxID=137266 RepID=A0AAE3YKJ7_9ACTN|nr:DUF6519 domain-containing protein [Catenuloplanes atrovinosus]MDR7275494.1 hypothetical protein [Catenuloplanes atrovinosus]